jgi:hypothetical protein
MIQKLHIRVETFNQIKFLTSGQAFNFFFSLNCLLNPTEFFIVKKKFDIVFCSKTFGIDFLMMLQQSFAKIIGDTSVKNSSAFVGEDIDIKSIYPFSKFDHLFLLKIGDSY